MEEIRNIENRDNDYFYSFLCKENDNKDNKLPYLKLSHVVIRCCLKENDNIDNKDNSLIKKVVSRCHSLSSKKMTTKTIN